MIRWIPFFRRIAETLETILEIAKRMEEKMTASQADLDNILSIVQNDVSSAVAKIGDSIAEIKALIAASAPLVDLTAEVTRLTDMHTALTTALAAIPGNVPAPAAPADPAAPTPSAA